MPETDLARVPGQEHQADAGDCVDEQQAEFGEVVVLQTERRCEQKDNDDRDADFFAGLREETNIVVDRLS